MSEKTETVKEFEIGKDICLPGNMAPGFAK